MSGILPYFSILNTGVSWGLFILIWLVQLIIYPGLIRIPAMEFTDYHNWYMARISTVVLPLMICEAFIAIAWFFLPVNPVYASLSGGLVAIVWLSTFTLQVPIHRRLRAEKDELMIRRLVIFTWSLKAVIVTIAAARSV